MRFDVLAIDYDGTIAERDVCHPKARRALDDARQGGVTVVLATGRVLSDLRRVAGDLEFAEAVVAENGAVLTFPRSGRTIRQHGPPDPAFVAELRRRGVSVTLGECIVEADAAAAPVILDVIRASELPLVLAFNRARVMVLPQAVSKATGLREVLGALRLSTHNTLAIGDAENDHELLAAAEVGVAVRWGSPALCRVADLVLEGTGPAALPSFLAPLVRTRRLPPANGRRRVLLGQTDEGRPVTLAIRDRNVLVSGDPRSGKSWVAGLLTEQLMLARYCVAVIDPEGDYHTLEALPGTRVIGEDRAPAPGDIERAFRFPDGALVIDLSHVKHARKLEYMSTLLPALAALRGWRGLPHRVVVDEAHYFLRDLDADVGRDVAHGGYTFITYRPSELGADLVGALGVVIATRTTDAREAEALAQCCGPGVDRPRLVALLAGLSTSEAVLLPSAEEAGDAFVRFKVAPRLTPHVRHRHKYADLPVPRRQQFVFTGVPGAPAAVSLAGFVSIVEQLEADALRDHLRRHDFSRWLAEVFGDETLARTVAAIEDAHVVGTGADAGGAVVAAIRDRYAVKDAPVP
ncbi:MAG TPA: HAD family hydrolase [Vicinamibacterales bacterium]|nr:HAD family hydrolase [Vicinamibacterales bacterium]